MSTHVDFDQVNTYDLQALADAVALALVAPPDRKARARWTTLEARMQRELIRRDGAGLSWRLSR